MSAQQDTSTQPTILVVEDSETMVELYKTWLSNAGYDVRTAYTKDEAIEKWTSDIDGAIVDISLKLENGLDVVEQVVNNGNTARIAVVTGRDPIAQDELADHVVTQLTKPVVEDDILTVVESLVTRDD